MAQISWDFALPGLPAERNVGFGQIVRRITRLGGEFGRQTLVRNQELQHACQESRFTGRRVNLTGAYAGYSEKAAEPLGVRRR